MALTEIKTSGIADDAVTTDKLANAINTERTANTSKPSLANDSNNRVVTGDGSGGLNGEANLTFDGTTLAATGAMSLSGTADPVTITVQNTDSNTATDSGGDIVFKGSKTNGDPLYFGGIGGRRRNQGSDETGYLALYGQNGDGSNAAAEALRIDHTGRVLIGTTTEGDTNADNLTIADSNNCGITIRSGDTQSGLIYFSDGTSGPPEYAGFIQYSHGSTNVMYLGAGSGTRMEIASSGNVKISDGDLVIGTDGHGIDFSATSDATGKDNELLDEYEEGTWTPTWDGGSNFNYDGSNSNGEYVKVGSLVHIRCFIAFGNPAFTSGGQSWDLIVGGLPFAPSVAGYGSGVISVRSGNMSAASGSYLLGLVSSSEAKINLKVASATNNPADTNLTAASCGNYTQFNVQGTYHTTGL